MCVDSAGNTLQDMRDNIAKQACKLAGPGAIVATEPRGPPTGQCESAQAGPDVLMLQLHSSVGGGDCHGDCDGNGDNNYLW